MPCLSISLPTHQPTAWLNVGFKLDFQPGNMSLAEVSWGDCDCLHSVLWWNQPNNTHSLPTDKLTFPLFSLMKWLLKWKAVLIGWFSLGAFWKGNRPKHFPFFTLHAKLLSLCGIQAIQIYSMTHLLRARRLVPFYDTVCVHTAGNSRNRHEDYVYCFKAKFTWN